MQTVFETVLSLIKSAITGNKVEIPKDVDWNSVLKLCKSHQIAPIVFYGTVNSNIVIPADVQDDLFNVVVQTMAQEANQFATLEKIGAAFKKEGIDYLPIKGTVIKKLYPKSEMRAMSDMDILIRSHQLDAVCGVLEAEGYEKSEVTENVTVYRDRRFVSLEMHTALLPKEDADYYDYFSDPWSKAQAISENRYGFSNEDEFIFDFVHMVKHYREGGVGIRHLLDVWVMLNNFENLDKAYILKELDKLGLCEFYNNIVSTVMVWFEGAEPTKITDFITERTFKSGSYGVAEMHYAARAARVVETKGKEKNNIFLKISNTVFLPMSAMKDVFPILNKAPVLLPVMWVVRGFKTIFIKPKNIHKQVNRIKNSTNSVAKEYSNDLEFVGLRFK